jgi:hypothetical protein
MSDILNSGLTGIAEGVSPESSRMPFPVVMVRNTSALESSYRDPCSFLNRCPVSTT